MTPQDWSRIQQGIFAGESGGDYGALYNYQNRPNGRFSGIDVTKMTVDQALDFASPSGPYGQYVKSQVGRVATPMGAYQVVGSTLRDAKRAMGLKGDEVLTPQLQDQIGQWIYKTQGTGAWEGYKGAAANNTETKPMMQEQQPRGLLGSLGIQKRDEAAGGETAQPFYQRDTFKDTAATLAQGFAAMGSMPALQKMTADIAQQRTEVRAKNKTLEMLRKMPNGEELVKLAEIAGPMAVAKQVMKQRLEGPAELSAKEASIQRLVSTGLSRDVAIGIVDGRLELSRDPITGEATVVDLGAPSSAAAPAAAPEGEPVAEGDDTFAGANVERATGLSGFLGGAVNTVVDAFGGGQPYDKIADAQSKLNLLSTQTTLGMAAEFPGRPSNLTREEVRKLTILPSEITTGPGKALDKAETLLDMVGKQLAAAQAVVNGRYSPQDKSKAQASIRYLEPLLKDYSSLVDRLSQQRSPEVQQPGQAGTGIRPEVADRLGAYN